MNGQSRMAKKGSWKSFYRIPTDFAQGFFRFVSFLGLNGLLVCSAVNLNPGPLGKNLLTVDDPKCNEQNGVGVIMMLSLLWAPVLIISGRVK